MSIYYRRNIKCLSNQQLHDFREALQAMYDLPESDEHSFAKLGGLHGLPSPSYCEHWYPGFLTWHRAYMLEFENALRCINPKVTLPFWDWSSGPTTGLPPACVTPTYTNRNGNTAPNPLYSGPISPLAGGGVTNRRPDIDITVFDDLAAAAQSALAKSTFDEFQRGINGPHGGIHGRVGGLTGQMRSVPRAAFDPLFFLHHSNVDRLWAIWQTTHAEPLPTDEATLELEPFNKPYSTEWRKGTEYFSTETLGYGYSPFCLILPPFFLWELMEVKLDPQLVLSQPHSAILVLKSDKMSDDSLEIRAFINEPNVSADTKTHGNPHFAGTLGIFGMGGHADGMKRRKVKNERVELELDITKALKTTSKGTKDLSLTLVPVGLDGKAIPKGKIAVGEIELLAD